MRGETRLTRRWTMRLTRRYMVIEVGFVYLTRRSVVCRLLADRRGGRDGWWGGWKADEEVNCD